MDIITPPRFVGTPPTAFAEEERRQLAKVASDNIDRILGQSSEQTIPLASTSVGIITVANTGDDGFIVTVESTTGTDDAQASSIEELQRLQLHVLGQIWHVSNDEVSRIAHKQFTGHDIDPMSYGTPLDKDSEDPDDPAPFSFYDMFDEGVPATDFLKN